jgi:MFS transporter, PHS family, inorganic phosphate transporter
VRSSRRGSVPRAAAGAIVGAFGAAQDPKKPDHGYAPGIGIRNTLFLLASTNFRGMLMSLFVPEPKGKSLEEISKDNVGDDQA